MPFQYYMITSAVEVLSCILVGAVPSSAVPGHPELPQHMGPLTATTYAATTEVLEDIHIAGRLWTTLPLPTDTEIKCFRLGCDVRKMQKANR